MTRSRLTRSIQPIAACLLVGMLAACGGGANRVVTQGQVSSEWPRPDSAAAPGPANDPWGPWIEQASRRFDVPDRWIREVMRQESGGRQSATSRVGAMGLMQVMPGTYAELRRRHDLGSDPYHPWDNIMAGTAYLRQMYDLYGAPAFLAAYNAGPRRLEDYLWGSRGLPDETRNYVARIGPRIQGTSPSRRAPPEVYAAAELPLDIPRGPRRGDPATMLALREQRRAVEPGIQVAQLPPGPVVRMDPIPDGSTSTPPVTVGAVTPPRTQLASAGPVVAMPPVAGAGDFERRMDPVVSPGDPGTIRAETLAPPPGTRQVAPGAAAGTAVAAAPAAPRGFALIAPAQAGTLPVPPRGPASAPAIATGGAWGIQVGAFASENLARAAAGQARDQIGAQGTRLVVERVVQGRGLLYRARVVGLSSRNSAEQACDRLRGRGGCMIVAPGA
jgi:cell division septation protein DedD